MNIKSLLTRSLSGLIYVGIIIGAIFWGRYPFGLLACLFGILATLEFKSICNDSNIKSVPALILDCIGVCCLALGWMVFPLYIWACIYICRLVMELYLKHPNPIRNLSLSLMTQLYIGFPLGAMTFIGETYSLHFVLAIFLMIWINDTGAFIVGCSIGRHRLFERISPKKSWEGFFGGLIFNLLTGWLFAIGGGSFWGVTWSIPIWLFFGALVTIFSTWGDLIESLLKRSLGIKDSGKIIPGHGGILDRIDSLLLVMPAAMLFLLFLEMA